MLRHSSFEVPQSGCVVVARQTDRLSQWFAGAGHDVSGVPKPGAAMPAAPGEQVRVVSGARVLIGDPEQWQGTYGALARESQQRPVLAIGVDPAQWRTLFRDDPLPPPILDPHEYGLWRTPNGKFRRVRLRDGLPWQFCEVDWGETGVIDQLATETGRPKKSQADNRDQN